MMIEPYSIFPIGDQAVTLTLGNSINQVAHQKLVIIKDHLNQRPFEGMIDILIAYNSMTVIYDAVIVSLQLKITSPSQWVQQYLKQLYDVTTTGIGQSDKKIKDIPVCYEDPFSLDSDDICKAKGLSREGMIELHTRQIYQVYMIGFLPGFPYMAEVAPDIVMPRKEKPRKLVPAGSVGIAGVQTGIYPFDSPGGWQIIGRTPFRMFDLTKMPPVLLEAGDRIRFYPISARDFDKLQS